MDLSPLRVVSTGSDLYIRMYKATFTATLITVSSLHPANETIVLNVVRTATQVYVLFDENLPIVV